MRCPLASEIKKELLSPRFGDLLGTYISRWMIDPGFLVYHRESTTLALRSELGCSLVRDNSPCRCHHVRLAECCIADTLKEAMAERITEQEVLMK